MDLIPEVRESWRASLIAEISKTAGLTHIDSATWAMLWLSDKESLDGFIRSHLTTVALRSHDNVRTLRTWLGRTRKQKIREEDEKEGSRKTQKRDYSKMEGLDPGSLKSETRSELAKKKCRERDKNACILTLMQEPVEICHIFPFAAGQKGPDRNIFWAVLAGFWSEKRISAWKAEIFGEEGTEVCHNLLALCANAHGLWDKARFALEPMEVSENKEAITLRFFWLPTNKFCACRSITSVPSLTANVDAASGSGYTKMFNSKTETKIQSGDLVKITTDNPETHPLPSHELLKMQWVLQRVAAMSGAADVSDEELDDLDDVGCGGGVSVLASSEVSVHARGHRGRSSTPRTDENRSPVPPGFRPHSATSQKSLKASRESSSAPTEAATDNTTTLPYRPAFH